MNVFLGISCKHDELATKHQTNGILLTNKHPESESPFVLVHNDRFRRIRVTVADTTVPQLNNPQMELPAFLGCSSEDLEALRYGCTNAPVFTRDKLFDEGAGAGFLTTAALAGILREAAIPCVLVGESEFEGHRPPQLPLSALAVGISTTHLFEAEAVKRLVIAIRSRLRGTPVIIGGAGSTLNPDWLELSGADYLILGDAEIALPTLLERLKKGMDTTNVPNLRWLDNGEVRCSVNSHYCDLDSVPTPRPDLTNQDGRWPRAFFYESRRGCPYGCAFCSYPRQSPRPRYKSAERMVEEFAVYAERGVKFLACHDSSMLTPVARMHRFNRLLIERGTPLFWGCWGYPNELQQLPLLQDMFQAGCRYVAVGVESADEGVLGQMNRHGSIQALRYAIANVRAAGMLVSVQILVGFPGETSRSIKATLQFIGETEPDYYSVQPFQIRDMNIPAVLEAERYGLELNRDGSGAISGWRHNTMDSTEAEHQVRVIQTHIALKFPRTLYHGLLRTGSPLGIAPLAEKDSLSCFKNTVRPVLKEWECACMYHPDSTLGAVPKDMSRFREYRDRARHRLAGALSKRMLIAGKSEDLAPRYPGIG